MNRNNGNSFYFKYVKVIKDIFKRPASLKVTSNMSVNRGGVMPKPSVFGGI